MKKEHRCLISDFNKVILDNVDSIVTHPDNLKILRELVDGYYEEQDYCIRTQKLHVYGNPHVSKYTVVNKYERTKVLPDTKFVNWVTDLKNPSSWAIFFGLVKEVEDYKQPVFYFYNSKNSTALNSVGPMIRW